jgi:hypothetical protein
MEPGSWEPRAWLVVGRGILSVEALAWKREQVEKASAIIRGRAVKTFRRRSAGGPFAW